MSDIRSIDHGVSADTSVVYFIWIVFLCAIPYFLSSSLVDYLIWLLPGFPVVVGLVNGLSGQWVRLSVLFWVTSYFLFFVAPVAQLESGQFMGDVSVRGVWFSGESLLYVAVCFASWFWGIHFFLWRFSRGNFDKSEGREAPWGGAVPLHVYGGALLVGVVLVLGVVAVSGVGALVASSRYERVESSSGSPLAILVSGVARGYLLALLLVGLRDGGLYLLKLLSVCCVAVLFFLLNNPVSTARFGLIGMYFPVAWVLLGGMRTRVFVPLVFCGLLLMPLGHIVRGNSSDIRWSELQVADSVLQFRHLDFDAASMASFAIVNRSDFNYPIGYFTASWFTSGLVPRVVWPEKPVESGKLLGEYLIRHQSGWFSNLSMPPLGDLILDFGFLGVVLGSVLFGLLVQVIDRRRVGGADRIDFEAVSLLVVAGHLPILVRGSIGAISGGLFWVLVGIALYFFFFDRARRGRDGLLGEVEVSCHQSSNHLR